MIIKRKEWQEYENYQLWLGYSMNASLKVLEEYLGRTLSAITKQLDRTGIREKVRQERKNGFKPAKIISAEHLENLIIMCGLDDLSVGIERRHTRSWSPSDFTKAALSVYGIEGPSPWKKRAQIKKLPLKSGIGRTSLNDDYLKVSSTTCAHYLKRYGYEVKYYTRSNPCNWKFLVNGKAVTEAGLLRETNIVRLKNGEPIFYIEGVTFEG